MTNHLKFSPVHFVFDLNDPENVKIKSELKLINSMLNTNQNSNLSSISESGNSIELKSIRQGSDWFRPLTGNVDSLHHHFNSKIGRSYSLNLGRIKKPTPVISIFGPSLLDEQIVI